MASLLSAIASWLRQQHVFPVLMLALAFCLGCERFSDRSSFSVSTSVTQRDGHREIRSNRLYANGQYDGKLQSGCHVDLDEQGQVLVDGVKREPQPE